jgi:CDP-diacylglycerol--glycerol-3-phosphate 3-phosphatidyltransferase
MVPRKRPRMRLRRVRTGLKFPARFRKLRRPRLPRISFVDSLTKLPNLLTYIRILSIPLIVWLTHQSGLEQDGSNGQVFWSFWAFVAYTLSAITDFLDGWLARTRNLSTLVGRFLDPLADKLLVMALLIQLVVLGRIDPWIAIVLIGREMFINGLRAIASSEGLEIPVNQLGKWKTFIQMIALGGLILPVTYTLPIIGTFPFHTWGWWFIIGSLALSLLSAVVYLWNFVRVVVAREASS